MSAQSTTTRGRALRRFAGILAASALAVSVLGGPVQAANSRQFIVSVSAPTPASQGGATSFNVDVVSTDNQTIANVVLSIPAAGQAWPAGITIADVFGADASMCQPTNGTSLTCDFGNLAAFGSRSISILANVGSSVPVGSSVTFTASAETNNENGANRQVVSGTSTPLQVIEFDANAITTFKLTGQANTSPLGATDAGNLQTIVKLLQNNGGVGNAVAIVEGTDETQPAYCVALKLTCQPDFATVTVNNGSPISPYLETVLVAQVPNKYNIKKAFLIHVLDNGQTEVLYNDPATSCALHPNLIPCADFLLVSGIVTITIHTESNGKFQF